MAIKIGHVYGPLDADDVLDSRRTQTRKLFLDRRKALKKAPKILRGIPISWKKRKLCHNSPL